MSAPAPPAPAPTFAPGRTLALVVIGSLLFVAALWMLGTGIGDSRSEDAGIASADSHGLNGFAALADYLGRRNFAVARVRSARGLRQPGLLILTPTAATKGQAIDTVVKARRGIGPTLVILPKWQAVPLPRNAPGMRPGWVMLLGAETPSWRGFADDLAVGVEASRDVGWHSGGLAGRLPEPKALLTGRGPRLVPLVSGGAGQVLAGYVDDGSAPDSLRELAVAPAPRSAAERDLARYPVLFVFDPDLVNDYGFARGESALLAERLVRGALGGEGDSVAFDLTLAGEPRGENLLTLAFTPPFLAATVCLLLAAFVVGWRAFNRFGPPEQANRAVAFGKAAVLASSAGLIRRARRTALLGTPYADAARERLAQALGLPPALGRTATEAAIDRALAARGAPLPHFTEAAAALGAAGSPSALLRAAEALHALERTLIP